MSERNEAEQKGAGFEKDLCSSIFRYWGVLEEIRERAAAEGLPLWIDQEVTCVLQDWEQWVDRQLD